MNELTKREWTAEDGWYWMDKPEGYEQISPLDLTPAEQKAIAAKTTEVGHYQCGFFIWRGTIYGRLRNDRASSTRYDIEATCTQCLHRSLLGLHIADNDIADQPRTEWRVSR